MLHGHAISRAYFILRGLYFSLYQLLVTTFFTGYFCLPACFNGYGQCSKHDDDVATLFIYSPAIAAAAHE